MTVLLPVAVALAAPDPHVPPPLGIAEDVVVEAYTYCLPSGLRVLLSPRRGRDDVTLVMVLEAGASADPPGREGLAHLVEHLWFRTPHLGPPDLWAFAESTGADLDGSTTPDTVRYVTRGSKRSLRALLQVEGERLLDPLAAVDEATFAVEREIVRNELRQQHLDTGRTGVQGLFEGLFPADHPYARPSIGTMASLDASTLAEARAWASERYRPSAATLVVRADVDPQGFGQLLQSALPEAARAAPASGPVACGARSAPPRPPPPSSPSLRREAHVDERAVVFGWAVPAGLEPSGLAQVAVRHGRRFMAGRIGREVRCGVSERRLANLVTCSAELGADEDPVELVRSAVGSLELAWVPEQQGVVEVETDAWSRAHRSAVVLGLEEVEDGTEVVSLEVAEHYHATGDPRWFLAATGLGRHFAFAHQARELGREWLTGEGVVTVLLEPAAATDVAPSADVHAARGALVADAGRVDLERLRHLVPDVDLSGMRSTRLQNGLSLVVLPLGDLPLVRTSLVLPGGYGRASVPALDHVAYEVASDARGVWLPYGWTGISLVDAAAAVGGRWTAWQGTTGWGLGIDGANLPAQLYLLRRRIDDALAAKVRPNGWEAWLTEEARELEADPDGRASIARRRHLAPGLAPSWYDAEGLAAAAELRRRDIHDWKRRVLQPEGATLLVVGKVDPAEVELEARRWLGSWGTAAEPPAVGVAPDLAPLAASRVVVVPTAGRTQSTVTLACRLDPAEGDVAASLVATSVESRLFDELRQARGQTYGVEADLGREDLGLVLEVSTRVPHAAAPDVVAALRDVVRSTATVDDAALDRLKLATARRLSFELQTTEEVLDRLQTGLVRGELTAGFLGRAEALAVVSGETLGRALGPCVGREIVTVVGPQALAAELGADVLGSEEAGGLGGPG